MKRPRDPNLPKCGANSRQNPGRTCAQPAGWGTPHSGTGRCKLHGGSVRQAVIKAQREAATELTRTYGAPRTIDPRDGIIEEYYRTAGAVSWLEQIVADLSRDDLVWGVVEERTGDSGGEPDEDGNRRPVAPAVISKAAPSVWLKLFNEERDRFARLGLDIIKLGLEARRDEWIQAQAVRLEQLVASMSRRLLEALPDELGLSAGQRQQLTVLSGVLPGRVFAAEVARLGAATPTVRKSATP